MQRPNSKPIAFHFATNIITFSISTKLWAKILQIKFILLPIRIHSLRQRTGTKKRGYGKIHSPATSNRGGTATINEPKTALSTTPPYMSVLLQLQYISPRKDLLQYCQTLYRLLDRQCYILQPLDSPQLHKPLSYRYRPQP